MLDLTKEGSDSDFVTFKSFFCYFIITVRLR